LESKGEVCLEEEVEKRRRSGMSTDEISQDLGVDPSWVESLVSMVADEDSSTTRHERD
jgi:DNA-binding CsgD family transcriptional regulator